MSSCRKCNCLLTDSNWAPSRQARRHYVCKKCCYEYHKEYRKSNRVKLNKTGKKWASKKRASDPLYARKSKLKYKYNLTLADYDKMLGAHDGKCAICGGVNKNGRRLCVDHNHKTNKIRGLLCKDCNLILGFAKDSVGTLLTAVTYLRGYDE